MMLTFIFFIKPCTQKHIFFLYKYQDPFEDGLANGEEPSAAEEAAAKEAKGGTVKFGWVKGVLVSAMVQCLGG